MPIADDQALSAHFQAVESEAMSQVCARHISGFAAEFERLYQAWRQANAEALAKGAILAEAKGMNRVDGPNLRSFANMEAEVLDSIPSDDRQRRCNELLARFPKASK
jgi:hypothetical protein